MKWLEWLKLPSVAGMLNLAELGKVFWTGVLMGLIGLVTALVADINTIVVNPAVASLAAMILGWVLQALRQLQKGPPIPPQVPPAP